ncbi:isocitrate/isopropylmalate dehydrogenase family protein [[Clostridium] aminophilum]|uniref:Isocitrate dehydrogenase (NAD+) n=1 Tax=[Clostridium] aminophilum TaxID=1526 RepID=A0A1I6IN08_9FIRM|nr:isocitrate/isopropylmalate dehydrogenase family protein [[Clostridium] aminophilum]SFR67670.1 isocitrate dehydrogenase (NAD+) [[Clostridium] aminophilum]
MDKHTVTVFRGDGIGPELVEAAMKVLDCAGAPLSYEVFDVGEAEYERNGKLIPDEALASFERTRVMLKSPITTPVGKGFRSLNVTLRGKYNLYANIRPVKTIPAIDTPFKNVDIVIFRENTEGLYAGVEDVISEDEVHALKIVTRPACENIIRAAFDYAVKNGRKKVTCVHKANIIKRADGMFLSIFRDIAKEYPDIEADDKIIDNTCMQLVMRPEQFDIMVMQNLYGDILSDLCSGLVGGLGVVPSSNVGADHAMFEAVHGSAPDIAGQRIANPTAFLWSACLMLDHLGEKDCADRIRKAIDQVLNEGKHLTRDLHGNAGMDEFVDAICEKL